MSSITILGLGPGDAALLTRQAWELLQSSSVLYLRTAVHPTVAALPAHLELRSFDSLYESVDEFGQIYERIAADLVERAQAGEPILYAVPGHPLVAEATTRRLLTLARARQVATRIVAGLSFVEPVCAALALDPLEHGLQLLDALDLIPEEQRTKNKEQDQEPRTQESQLSVVSGQLQRTMDNEQRTTDNGQRTTDELYLPPLLPYPLVPTRPALICQVYNRRVASHAKLSLMERYPAAHPIVLVRAAGVNGDERVWSVPLHELDHQGELDHLTCAYVPPLDPLADLRGPEGVTYVAARLLGPGGCPWDREQTHQSLRPELLEETYEVLEALDAGDMSALAEELGDLLLSVLMHSEMARQAGEFDLGDVYEHIAAKLIRRHPHVFGDTSVSGSDDVLRNWEAIKRAERAASGQAPRGLFDGIPAGLPALMAAQETIRKASKAGFDSADMRRPWDKLREEVEELHAAAHSEPHADERARARRVEEEFGDLMLAVAKLGYRLDVDAESALRAATAKFRRRFAHVERQLEQQGRDLLTITTEEKEDLWRQAKTYD